VLSLEELIEGYSTIYGREVGKQIALDTFSKLDINHNNSLEFSEFVTFGLKQQRDQEEGKLREAFQLFDRDRNGKISKDEISLVLRGKIDASI
jgi:calcium-dependent protein kinase